MKYELLQHVGAFRKGEIRGEEEFSPHADFAHLLAVGAIFPTEGGYVPPAADGDAEGWKRRAELAEKQLAEVEQLKNQVETQAATIEAITPTSTRAFDALGVDQLKALAQHKGLTVPDGSSKADIIGLLNSQSEEF